MIWIILYIVAYIASCAWFWYEIYIDDDITSTNWLVVMLTFIPIINLLLCIMFSIWKLDMHWEDIPNKFFRK